MFYTKVTYLKLLNHLTKFWSGLHTVDAVDSTQVIKTLFRDAEGIPQYINAMEAAQQKTKRVKLVIHDEYMHAVALNFMFQSGEYKTGVLETPGRPANLDSVENDLLGGLRCEMMLRSRLVGRRKTLWCFCHIWSCTWKESKKATTEARTSKNSGARPAHK